MRIFATLILIVFCTLNIFSQNKLTTLEGTVKDTKGQPIAGATVLVKDSRIQVNSNEEGAFILKAIPGGNHSLIVSFIGYKTSIINFDSNTKNIEIELEKGAIALEPITVTAQQREQQALDLPITMTTLSGQMLDRANIENLEQMAVFVPGLNIRTQTPHRPNFSIRGLTSDEVSTSSQPRVSVYYNNVPTNRASMSVSELYDMERVEVLKGPQGTLFGRGAQIGVINFITRKPTNERDAYLSAGFGNYGKKEFEGAVNMPIIDNKLMARASGIYSYHDGLVKNTAGGDLNGKKTIGGRFALRFMPIHNLKMDLTVNYQKDDEPGTAFMSKKFANANGETNIFKYEASLDKGKNLYNKRDLLGTSFDVKYYFNENSYLSLLSSYYDNSADSRWDGDGTIAPAIDMSEHTKAKQFTEELRYNFSVLSRLNGFVGASYWTEKVDQNYWFGPNEQYFYYLLAGMQEPTMLDYMIGQNGQLGYPMTNIPNDPSSGPMAGMLLPTDHEEMSISGGKNSAFDIFADATFKLLPKLSLSAGIRASFESFKTSQEAYMLGTTPSVLGMMTGASPNLFFAVTPKKEIKKDFSSVIYRANLMYEINSSSNVFAGYSKGRRPNVLQFDAQSESEVLAAEIVHSFETGYKWTAQQRFWFDLGAFYQLYSDFQTTKWENGNYLIDDAGEATSYGIETSVKVAVNQYLDVFGNYSYIRAKFDDKDSDDNAQLYAGKTFRLTPKNSFALGATAKLDLTPTVQMAFTPTYSWKSHVYFEDENLPDLEQNAYGLLNLNLAFNLKKPNMVLTLFSSNILDEKYIISAGNTGMMFGVPTFVPGTPRMFGAKLRWNLR